MSDFRDPELDDLMQGDPELLRIARMLASSKSPQAPLDDAFRARLRRQLMDQAWDTVEGKRPWWSGFMAPQRVAWVGAAAVLVIAATVVYTVTQPVAPSTTTFLQISSPLADQQDVASVQAIPVKFNVPMDHPSTEAAVQVTPATAVAFSWSGDQLLYVTPKSGDLAPNTQYQVTIGPGAKAQNGTANSKPQTLTFVTASTPTPSPSASPTPSPSTPATTLTGERQLTTDYPTSDVNYPVAWSADSRTVYFVGPSPRGLESVSLSDGSKNTIVPDGVSIPTASPVFNRLAYVRNGEIEILDLATGRTAQIATSVAPTALAWVRQQLYWGSALGIFRAGVGEQTRVLTLPDPNDSVVSIAPDGNHALLANGQALAILDLSTQATSNVGQAGDSFVAWSPDGTRLVLQSGIYDSTGHQVSGIPPGDVSWSRSNEILIGSDTGIFEQAADGSGYTELEQGTFRSPAWAPDGSTFVFVRGSSLWVATAPSAGKPSSGHELALQVVSDFMQARLKGQDQRAASFLDAKGQAAYATGSPALIPQGSPGLRRWYRVMSEVNPVDQSVRVVVRLIFASGGVERSSTEETLTLVRAQATDPYLIDNATAGPQLQFGKGPQVIFVKLSPAKVAVLFDSDLLPTSVGSVTLQDDQGKPVAAKVDYSDRIVTLSNLQLVPGAHYRLVVLPGLQDVGNHNVAAEYDVDFVGPSASDPIAAQQVQFPGGPAGRPTSGPFRTPSASAPPA